MKIHLKLSSAKWLDVLAKNGSGIGLVPLYEPLMITCIGTLLVCIAGTLNTFLLNKNGFHCAPDILKHKFLKETFYISIQVLLNFAQLTNNTSALRQIVAVCRCPAPSHKSNQHLRIVRDANTDPNSDLKSLPHPLARPVGTYV